MIEGNQYVANGRIIPFCRNFFFVLVGNYSQLVRNRLEETWEIQL